MRVDGECGRIMDGVVGADSSVRATDPSCGIQRVVCEGDFVTFLEAVGCDVNQHEKNTPINNPEPAGRTW